MAENQDVSELAQEVVRELDPGTTIGEKIILSRRQLIAIAGGGMSLGALATFGAEEASAQSVGSVGTESEPVTVYATNFTSESVSGGYELTIDGDTYQFNE